MKNKNEIYTSLLIMTLLAGCGGGAGGESNTFNTPQNNSVASSSVSSSALVKSSLPALSSSSSLRSLSSSSTPIVNASSSKSNSEASSSSSQLSSTAPTQTPLTSSSSSSTQSIASSRNSSSAQASQLSANSSSQNSVSTSSSSLSVTSASSLSKSSTSLSSSSKTSSAIASANSSASAATANSSSSNLSSKSSSSSSSAKTSSSSSTSSSSQTSSLSSSSSSSPATYSSAGLLWPNGIEPGDPSVCEAPNGKRCWWVDANASNGGNGNYATPYNSFQVLEQNVRGGDFVYVRGTFDMATDSPSHKMSLNFYTNAASGTANDPTTLKSWRGSARAVFSSNRTSAQLRMTRTGGVRIQNIEITNFGDVGISVDETVSYAELINIVSRDGRVTQSSGIGGGVRFYMQDTLHTFIIRNSLFENTSAPSETGGNVGALSIISEPSAQAGSNIKVYNNIFRGNHVAVRHKHAGRVHMEAYNNLIENNSMGFYLRTWSGDIHHNIIINNGTGLVLENENAHANHDYTIRYNTFYNNNYFLHAYPDWDENAFRTSINVQNNIFVASATGLGVFYIGAWDWNWGRLDRSLATWTMNNNIFYYQTATRKFLYSPPPTPEYTKNFTDGKAQFGDTTSALADPMFNDPANKDFTLKPGSPAIGAGSNGTTPGAVSGL